MSQSPPCRDARHGVIVIHAFGKYREAQFLEDPVLIDTLIAEGHSWRIADAVLLAKDP